MMKTLDHDMRVMYPDIQFNCYIDTDIVSKDKYNKSTYLKNIDFKELYKRRLNEKYERVHRGLSIKPRTTGKPE